MKISSQSLLTIRNKLHDENPTLHILGVFRFLKLSLTSFSDTLTPLIDLKSDKFPKDLLALSFNLVALSIFLHCLAQ